MKELDFEKWECEGFATKEDALEEVKRINMINDEIEEIIVIY